MVRYLRHNSQGLPSLVCSRGFPEVYKHGCLPQRVGYALCISSNCKHLLSLSLYLTIINVYALSTALRVDPSLTIT